ncbi:PaaI family thioesterase [Oricola thermophila]|uniref:PaaI family thioesterase n=1 Tax=Oricola thermophila TaxID=2742145 RepID=A0A6N1VH50_9HYPH|nr:PaaI family thioesterase [Oricola thermophila]QKV18479.1 PaaI family thioesterase [Oricola thermophila]
MTRSESESYRDRDASGGFGSVPPEAIGSLGGLEMLRKVVSGELPAPPISKTLSFRIVEVEEGRAVFKGMPKAEHLNLIGTVHGGWTATIMDSALACAVQTLLKKGEAVATTEFKVNLIRPITPETGEVTCEATVVSRGRTTGVSECRVIDGLGRVMAFGTETCAIFAVPAQE